MQSAKSSRLRSYGKNANDAAGVFSGPAARLVVLLGILGIAAAVYYFRPSVDSGRGAGGGAEGPAAAGSALRGETDRRAARPPGAETQSYGSGEPGAPNFTRNPVTREVGNPQSEDVVPAEPVAADDMPAAIQAMLARGRQAARDKVEHDLMAAPTASPSVLDEGGEAADEAPVFTAAELQQLQQSGAQVVQGSGGLIPGVTVRSGDEDVISAPAPQTVTKPDAAGQNSSQPADSGAPIFTGQARGYQMMYLMHPNARATSERELQTIIDSGVREVFLSVLTDGSFGKDLPYLAQVLRRLNEKARIITLELYLTNGPAQRRFKTTSQTTGFSRVDPKIFRKQIVRDADTRTKFVNMVREVKPVFELNYSLNPENQNIAVVMLEDNLNKESYRAMRALAQSVLGDLAEFVRNPCGGCYPGNDEASLGDGIERHNVEHLAEMGASDGVTLDGKNYYFPWESPNGGLSTLELMSALQKAQQRGLRYFALWRAERQGWVGYETPVDERVYEVPSAEQVKVEIELLRTGLVPFVE